MRQGSRCLLAMLTPWVQVIILPQLPKCWYYRRGPLWLAFCSFSSCNLQIVPDLSSGNPFKMVPVFSWHVPIIFWTLPNFLALDIPCPFSAFPAPAWNHPFSQQALRSFQWSVVFRNQYLGTWYAHCHCETDSCCFWPSQWTVSKYVYIHTHICNYLQISMCIKTWVDRIPTILIQYLRLPSSFPTLHVSKYFLQPFQCVYLSSQLIYLSAQCNNPQHTAWTLCFLPPLSISAVPWVFTYRSLHGYPLPLYFTPCSWMLQSMRTLLLKGGAISVLDGMSLHYVELSYTLQEV